MLTIPDVRQRQEFDCGAASLDAVFRFWGVPSRGVYPLANPVQGMGPDTVEALLRRAGFAVLSGAMLIPDLAHLTRSGRPVLCPIQGDAGGHWVVVAGVTRGRVHYQCPTHGPRSARLAAWSAGWSDSTRVGHGFERWGVCPHRS